MVSQTVYLEVIPWAPQDAVAVIAFITIESNATKKVFN